MTHVLVAWSSGEDTLRCAGLPPQPDLAAIKELEAIREAYTAAPGNPRYRFHHLFLNVVDNPAACQKPPGVDELRWREAMQRAGGPANPNHLWPVLAHGTKDLIARKDAQVPPLRLPFCHGKVADRWNNASWIRNLPEQKREKQELM